MDEQEISQVLSRHKVIAIDACVLIYHLEYHPRFGPAAELVLTRVQSGLNQAVVSTLALMEVLVGPYSSGQSQRAGEHYGRLQLLPNCRWIPLSAEIADLAASLRAKHRLGVPDAVHLATALNSHARLFVTNDRRLPPVSEIEYLVLG